jgi:DNA (cytosine-5)-methyltransferase 1
VSTRVAEFFAGIGLVRAALEPEGFSVLFANDIEPVKHRLYAANFDASHFVLGDVREVKGADLPDVDLATASFPCTDLSLAGNRAGLAGTQSSMFWEFARVLDEMGDRRPQAVLLENVVGFSTSRGGEDMRSVIAELNGLNYVCDLFMVDARWFVPQSRPRMFIVGSNEPLGETTEWRPTELRPLWLGRFVESHPELRVQAFPLRLPVRAVPSLRTVVERLPGENAVWWGEDRTAKFMAELSPIQTKRAEAMRLSQGTTWATAYRRTRNGRAAWEIRADDIAGCLRTARGGSSKQALVEAGGGVLRARWMIPREYARLQGVPDYKLDGVSWNQALFGLGDAVCVPVIRWIAREYLRPLLMAKLISHGRPRSPRRGREDSGQDQGVLPAASS